MSGPILKFEQRQTVNERLKSALERFEGELKAVVNNEGITRGRVDSIERVLGGFMVLPLRYRLKWLLFGMPIPPKEPMIPKEFSDQIVKGVAEKVEEPSVH